MAEFGSIYVPLSDIAFQTYFDLGLRYHLLPEGTWNPYVALGFGAAQIKIEIPCVRCVMTTLPQGDLTKDPGVLRTIVRDAAQNLGVYATVASRGPVAVGDAVELI